MKTEYFKKALSAASSFVKGLPERFSRFIKSVPDKTKNLPSEAKRTFKDWYYSDPKEKTESRGRAGALILSAFLVLAALYYLGVFDLTLIERPESWKENGNKVYSIFKDEVQTTEKNDGPTAGEETDFSEPATEEKQPDTVQSVDLEYKGKARRDQGADIETVFSTRDKLAEEGYYITSNTYDPSNCVVGSINFSYRFPAKFSYRDMSVRAWKITEYDDGRMSTAEDTVKLEVRPALYLYMGYIIFDDAGEALYIVNRDGTVLMNYNEAYIPAFERNENGRPLFYNTYGYYADVPATDEVNEAKEHTYTFRGAYVSGKNYYSLAYGGNYFAADDYIEERDGRGLCFDYPASYGLSDIRKYRLGIMSPKYSSFLDGSAALVRFMKWNYYDPNDPELPKLDEILDKQKKYSLLSTKDKLKAIKKKKTPDDEYKLDELLPYYAAYNFREGYATVITDKTDEEPKYETKELRVINTSGEITFASRKKYYNNEIKDYCSDRFLLPLSKGEESVGHLYFDHGLMRLRKVSFDQYQLDEFGVLRINSDSDVLVYPNGKEFTIPEGYTLKGYSDGILTLERGGYYGYMNTAGKWICDPKYTNASAFHGGLGVLTKQNGKVGAVDINGNTVIPFRYSYVSNRSECLVAAYSEQNGWELFGIFTK